MYLTGTQSDFESRLHSLALTSLPTGEQFITSGLNDINTFITEGRGYLAGITVTTQQSGKWEREARKAVSAVSGYNPTGMLTQQF